MNKKILSHMRHPSSTRGSVLMYILIAVALFAALSYTVSNIMRSGNTEIAGEQKANILADDILTTAEKMKQAVQGLRISNGCEQTGISFENTSLAGYTHSPVATDSCKLFHADGGDLIYTAPTTDFGSGTEWVFTGALSIVGLNTDCGSGDTCTELLAVLDGIKLPICKAINKKLGIVTASGNPPVQNDPVTFTKFAGSYTWAEDLDDDNNDNVLNGKSAACTQASGGGRLFLLPNAHPPISCFKSLKSRHYSLLQKPKIYHWVQAWSSDTPALHRILP